MTADIHIGFENSIITNGQRAWVSIKTEKENRFPSKTGEIEITIVPSFNRYFYAIHRRRYRKSISQIINRIKTISKAKIITLDVTFIENESNIDQVI